MKCLRETMVREGQRPAEEDIRVLTDMQRQVSALGPRIDSGARRTESTKQKLGRSVVLPR